mmetsp:Transcript_16177/g.26957  ORF Transcript_16177/g.26957 Transcript_16177/m.26957 type:complete len:270 (+) Transcript_16177:154-963(+)
MSRKQGMEQPSLKTKTFRQGHFRRSIDGLLGHDRSHLSLLGNSETHADGLLNKIVGGENSSHQSIPFRLLSIDHLSREYHIHRLGLTDSSDKSLRPTSTRNDAKIDLGLSKFGSITCHEDVALHRKLAPAAEGKSVYGCNDRLIQVCNLGPLREHVILVCVGEFPLAHLANVSSGSKRLGTSGNDHASDVILLIEGRRRIDQIVEQSVAQRIERLGTVEGDEADAALVGIILGEPTFDEDVFVFLEVGTCGREGTKGGGSAHGAGGDRR